MRKNSPVIYAPVMGLGCEYVELGRKGKQAMGKTKTGTSRSPSPNGDASVGTGAKDGVSDRAIKVEDFESRRLTFGFGLLLASLLAILIIFVLVIVVLGDRFDSAASVLSLIPTTTTVIGTLIGFYFGAQVGASGFARADINRQETTQQYQQLAQQAIGKSGNGRKV